MKSILITGCNRGIGLELVKYLLKDNISSIVIATCRDPSKAESLKELSSKYENLHILQLDMTDFCRYKTFAEEVSSILKGIGLNVLVNNAGILKDHSNSGLNLITTEQMAEHFLVNTTAPLFLTKILNPFLKEASKLNSSEPLGSRRAAVVNMSSYLGSIEGNTDGGYYPYRTSKAALNAVTRSLSLDLKDDKILVMSLHPGWIKTDMGGPNAPEEIETAASSIASLLLSLNEEHNGGFYRPNGQRLPW